MVNKDNKVISGGHRAEIVHLNQVRMGRCGVAL